MTRQTKVIAIALGSVAVIGSIALGMVVFVSGPGTSHERSVSDVVQHLERGGIRGVYTPLNGGHFGAKEGGRYTGEGFEVVIVLFEDEPGAEKMEQNGHFGRKCHRNGRFVLIGRKGEEKVVGTFKTF